MPGQYLRVGFDIGGKRHWRAYSLSSDASRPDGQITITVKRTADGVVSNYLHTEQAVGALVTLGEVAGQFVFPTVTPSKVLFLTAGSGITPAMAMIRSLERSKSMPDVLHIHSAHTAGDAIFGGDLSGLAERDRHYRFLLRATATEGRIGPGDLDALCPDWRERHTYACGPGAMLDGLRIHFEESGLPDRLHLESFEHIMTTTTGQGGTITFHASDTTTECDGNTVILQAGEAAGVEMPFGCRIGICHTCVGKLTQGSVRDLRTGATTQAGTEVRTCVNCPDGDITIEL